MNKFTEYKLLTIIVKLHRLCSRFLLSLCNHSVIQMMSQYVLYTNFLGSSLWLLNVYHLRIWADIILFSFFSIFAITNSTDWSFIGLHLTKHFEFQEAKSLLEWNGQNWAFDQGCFDFCNFSFTYFYYISKTEREREQPSSTALLSRFPQQLGLGQAKCKNLELILGLLHGQQDPNMTRSLMCTLAGHWTGVEELGFEPGTLIWDANTPDSSLTSLPISDLKHLNIFNSVDFSWYY